MFRHPLTLSMLVFFALGAALIVRVPMGASPDEAAHWQYIQYIASNHALPVFKGEVPPTPGYEFHQPPLYYALAAPGWAMAPAGIENAWARLVSLFCGALTLIFIWKSARLLVPDDRSIAILATAFAALWPLHIGVSSGSNNDAMGGLWAAALFWVGARVLLHGPNWRDTALIGLFIGLGALTKNTVLVVAAATLVALSMAPRAGKAPSGIVNGLAALAITTLIAGAWWARNTLLYGDPFALRVFSEAATKGTPGLSQVPFDPFIWLVYWRALVWLVFLTAWGFFGGVNSALKATDAFGFDGPIVPDLWMWPLLITFALAPLASFVGWRRLRAKVEFSPAQKRVFAFYACGFVLVALAWLNFAYNHQSGGQARYLHAALLPMCVFAALSWRGLWGTGARFKSCIVDDGGAASGDDAAQYLQVEDAGLSPGFSANRERERPANS